MNMADFFALPLKVRELTNAADDARGDLAVLGVTNSLSSNRDSIKAAAHAVNCHDDMLAAIRGALDGLRYWEPNTSRGHDEKFRILRQCEEAIAKAEGRS